MSDFAAPPDPDDPPFWVRVAIVLAMLMVALAFATVGGCQPRGAAPFGGGRCP